MVLPLAVSVMAPLGATPRLAELTVTVRVTDAAEGIEVLDAVPETLVPAWTTVIGTGALAFAL
jgi:hypothetical protein